MKKITLLALFCAIVAVSPLSKASAQSVMKIGVVNMLYVINESNKGKQSKQMIESQVRQATEELKKQKQEIDLIQNELQTSMILSDSAKREKQAQVQKMVQQLQKDQAEKEKGFRNLEREKTELIFKEVQAVVKKLAEEKKLDWVLESQIAAGFLYSRTPAEDITEEVLQSYNKAGK